MLLARYTRSRRPTTIDAMTDAKKAFEILMRDNADMLLAYLRASVRDQHAVDEIFQETMIVAWKRLEDFDSSRSFSKWLRGIAGKLVLAHFRKSGQESHSCDQATLEWLESRFAKIEVIRGDTLSEKLQLLRECVDALPADARVAIEARYMSQQSLGEIVQELGVASETIKKRLYRARRQLGSCLEQKLLAIEGQG